jgi:hypothetical protein
MNNKYILLKSNSLESLVKKDFSFLKKIKKLAE